MVAEHHKRDLEHYRSCNRIMGRNYVNHNGMGRDEEEVTDKQKALDLINSMPLKHWDDDSVDGRTVIYTATVEDNEKNREIIKQLALSDGVGLSDIDIDRFKSHRDGELEITHFVWNFANWFDGEKFII